MLKLAVQKSGRLLEGSLDLLKSCGIKIDNGEVNMEIGVALQRPAEFVIIKIGQYDGGTTVTVA